MENTPSANQPQQSAAAPAPAKNSKKTVTGIVVAALVVVALVIGKMLSGNSSDQSATGTKHGSYKDGTYTATGDYMTHVGSEEVTIGVTLKNNVITDTTFSGTPKFMMSQRFMDMFSANYKTLVVGKNIDDIHLGKISGSSLTPNGFNAALEKIKAQASS
jgi:uncharacterized protein with FMN-binding domain